MNKVELGKNLQKYVRHAISKGVPKTKIREALEVCGIAVSMGVGIYTLWRALTTQTVDEARLVKAIDELKLSDKELEARHDAAIIKINALVKDHEEELKKLKSERTIQYVVIGSMFVILAILMIFMLTKGRKK